MRIEVYSHPLEKSEPVVYEAEHIGAWLLDHYGESPDIRVQVFEGYASQESEVTGNTERLIASDAEFYTVLESPAGVDPFSWAAFAIAAILAVTAVLLMPKPAMPSNVNRTQASPNNSLNDRDNQLRMLQRIEDIYGQVRAIPSLMMPAYKKYKDNRLYEYGYYCISRGYIEATDIRDAETRIADIDGASAAVYWPFTSPNSGSPVIQIGDPIPDDVIQARRADEVDGITLLAPNQVQLPASANYDFVPDAGGDIIVQVDKTPNFETIAEPGDHVVVSMSPHVGTLNGSASVTAPNTYSMSGIDSIAVVGETISFTGFTNSVNNGAHTITSVAPNAISVSGATLVTEAAASVVATVTGPNLSGTYEIGGVGDGTFRLMTHTWTSGYTNYPAGISLLEASEWSGWVTVPDADRVQIWSNVVAAQGLYKDAGGGQLQLTIGFELQSELLDSNLSPTGIFDTVAGSISGNSGDEYAVTFERETPWKGPIRVRMRRTTDHDFGFEGTVIDEIKWQDLYAITAVPNDHFGNKTTIHTVTRATVRATSLRNRQVNCLAYRMLPTYDGTSWSGVLGQDGRLLSGNLYPTNIIADIIVAVSIDPKIGRRDISEIDVTQIYQTNAQVNALHPEAGTFNYTFDSDTMSYEETVTTIANAAFCLAYRQNGQIRLAFDRAQTSSTALFTHRNKKPKSDTITRKFASDSEYDGVEFVYQDPQTETSETIILPLTGTYTKLKKFEIPGIRSYAQAWLRANREYQKLIEQRLTLKTDTTGEARALLPNTRIDVADNTRYNTYDGEIVGQNGLELTLSRDVEFEAGANHSIVLIRRDGSLDSIPVVMGSFPNRVLLTRPPTEQVVTQYGPDGVRTIFSFATDSGRDAMAWLVQEIDQSDPKYVGITAINYSADYYKMDTQPIPPRELVING